MTLLFILSIILPSVVCHSWMTCPKSFITTNGRGGNQYAQCETDGSNAFITEVWAGDRLKVGWTSNNHAGGYVRLSLVKYGDHTGNAAGNNFLNNVLKFVCYGHDQRKGGNNGDCIHPCNGREGCQYQSDQYDIERYDTTIKIPTNLQGLYVLQAAMLVGNSMSPYYSCAKLLISKGNINLNCYSNETPLFYSCLKTGGPYIQQHFLGIGAKRGNFCYKFDGTIGGIDDDIRTAPINVECDPRLTCDNSVRSDVCNADAPTMKYIVNGNQPGCSALYTVPPAPPSCYDDVQNRDETGVDCGGTFCVPCPTTPSKVTPGAYFSSITQQNTYYSDGSGGNFKIIVAVAQDVFNSNSCWQLILQYENPVHIVSSWGDAELVLSNNQETIFTFERFEWTQDLKKGNSLTVYFSATNPKFSVVNVDGKIVWSDDTTRLQSATTLAVYPNKTQCIKQFPDPK